MGQCWSWSGRAANSSFPANTTREEEEEKEEEDKEEEEEEEIAASSPRKRRTELRQPRRSQDAWRRPQDGPRNFQDAPKGEPKDRKKQGGPLGIPRDSSIPELDFDIKLISLKRFFAIKCPLIFCCFSI